jgi:hypothetical protein
MGNILNFNVNKVDMRLSNTDYWDLYLAKTDIALIPQDTIISGACLVAHYDFNNNNIFDSPSQYDYQYTDEYGDALPIGQSQYNNPYAVQYGDVLGYVQSIYSLTTWVDAVNSGYTMPTIGLTGIDNGLLLFNKPSGDTTNQALLSTLTASTLHIPSGDTRLCLTAVSGMTGDYVYPVEMVGNPADAGNFLRLCGGFYQGYYKLDGNSYEVLPNRVPNTWTAELWLRKPCVDDCNVTGTTLNDVYTGNTGFFLYFGTRAENKFWNIFEGLNTGTTSGCTSGQTEWCTIPKETDVSVVNNEGYTIPLSPPPLKFDVIDNKFMMYSRASASSGSRCGRCGGDHPAGKTVCNFTGDTITLTSTTQVVTDDRNPFLIFSRASASSGSRCGRCGGDHPAGETVCSFSGFTTDELELDKDADLIDNAIGFRITPDGAIGYRKLIVTATCVNEVTVTGCSIEESYSASGVVTCDEWQMISIRFVANGVLDECEMEYAPARKGKLMFYVNRRLIYVVDDFDEFIARRLVEDSAKQVAVPYNISLGGGTQGLIESMTFDGQDPADMPSCLQNNFAGTFIGDISQFRFYICGMNYCDIKNNFEQERERYGLSVNS